MRLIEHAVGVVLVDEIAGRQEGDGVPVRFLESTVGGVIESQRRSARPASWSTAACVAGAMTGPQMLDEPGGALAIVLGLTCDGKLRSQPSSVIVLADGEKLPGERCAATVACRCVPRRRALADVGDRLPGRRFLERCETGRHCPDAVAAQQARPKFHGLGRSDLLLVLVGGQVAERGAVDQHRPLGARIEIGDQRPMPVQLVPADAHGGKQEAIAEHAAGGDASPRRGGCLAVAVGPSRSG